MGKQNDGHKKCKFSGGSSPEPDIDSPDLGVFILQDRNNCFDAISRFFKGYRRGILAVLGLYGLGKTKLVKAALERLWPLFRKIPRDEEVPRIVIGVWMDPSRLELSLKNTSSSSIKRTSYLNNTKPWDEEDFLITLIQALLDRLAPHSGFRNKGKGLRTKIGWFWYYFGFPTRVPGWLGRLLKRWCNSQNLNVALLFLCFLVAYLVAWLEICLVSSFLKNQTPFLSNFIPYYESFHSFSWKTWITALFIVIISWSLCRFIDWIPIKLRAKRLKAMTYAFKYQRVHHTNLGLGVNKRTSIPSTSLFSTVFNLWSDERSVYVRDIPNLLHELKIFLFQLHRLGIEPVLIVDELDKLVGTNLFKSNEKAGSKKNTHPMSQLTLRDWYWSSFFKTIEPEDTVLLEEILSVFLRFKEALANDLAIVIIGNLYIQKLMEESKSKFTSLHTLFKETVLLSPVSYNAWHRFLSEYNKKYCSNLPKCLTSNSSDPEKSCDKQGCKIFDQQGCKCISLWSALTWIEGRGRYWEMLESLRKYRVSGWPLQNISSSKKEFVRHVLVVMKESTESDMDESCIPGKPVKDIYHVYVQHAIMDMLKALFDDKRVYIPANIPDQRDTGFVIFQKLADQGLLIKRPVVNIQDPNLVPPETSWFTFERT